MEGNRVIGNLRMMGEKGKKKKNTIVLWCIIFFIELKKSYKVTYISVTY